jgi:hypothetical protein
MNIIVPQQKKISRPLSLVLSALLMVPLLNGCGGGGSQSSAPPVDNTRSGVQTRPGSQNPPQVKKGLSNTQKVAILAGAAALYYLYNKHKNAKAQGAEGQYYLSKNGRVYYRDAQKRAHWVTPPAGGIQVPQEEAQQYRDFQGYNNQKTGRDLQGLGDAPIPAQ